MRAASLRYQLSVIRTRELSPCLQVSLGSLITYSKSFKINTSIAVEVFIVLLFYVQSYQNTNFYYGVKIQYKKGLISLMEIITVVKMF